MRPLTALLPADASVMVVAPERVAGRAVSLAETNREFLEAAWAAATAGADAPVPTDDHGMQIYGIAKDQNGAQYYMVKNSWGTDNKYKGIWYVSKPFVMSKTINILVHKDAVPKDIRKKMGIRNKRISLRSRLLALEPSCQYQQFHAWKSSRNEGR